MATPSAFEQLTVELINQARLNPHGEFTRLVTNGPANVQQALTFFNVDLTLLAAQFAALTPVAPLAWNESLGNSSDTYSALMLARDTQSHTLDGLGLQARFANGGYVGGTRFGENIFAFASDALQSHAGFFIDWGGGPANGGIQNPPGHRNSIMSANFTELGVGHVVGTGDGSGPGNPVGPNLVTHHLANRGDYTAQIVGVIFNDADGDRFYDIGEGVAGATITATTGTANGYSTGGYVLDGGNGTNTLNFDSTLGLASIVVVLGADNIKVDMYDPGSFRSSVSANLGLGGVNLELLGEASIDATGNGANNTLIGNGGNNVLVGQLGADTLIGGLGNDTLDGGSNPEGGPGVGQGDVMLGGAGNDTYNVNSGLDLVDEGSFFPTFGFGGTDTIISTADFYWDIASVGEVVRVSADVLDVGNDGVTIVGGVFNNTLIGHSTTDVIFGRGGSDTYRAGDGIDFMSLSTLGVPDVPGSYTANGVNTVVVQQRTTGPNSYDIVFEFESGRDKLNVADYNFASTAAAFATGVNDGAGNSYFILGDGLDYLYMVGLTLSELSAGDFIV